MRRSSEWGSSLGDVFQVAPHEDQAAGAAFAFGGGDAGLGAPDLAFEDFFPVALGFQQLFFPLPKLLLEGFLPFQQPLEFFLWVHRSR